MPKITRKHQKILGENSSQTGIFGNAQKGIYDQLSNDPDVIQSDSWEQGWNSATFSGSKLPVIEEVQGVDYVTTRQIAYVMQEGIPEYSPDTTYYDSSLVKAVGTVIVYRSLSNDNKGNPLNDTNNWRMVCNFDTVQPLNNYDATVNPTVNDDVTLGYSAGSYWYNTVSEETFFCVDATTGAAVWVLQSSIDPSDLGTLAFQNNAGGVPALDPNSTGSTNVQGQSDVYGARINGSRASYPLITSGNLTSQLQTLTTPQRVAGAVSGFTNIPAVGTTNIEGWCEPKYDAGNPVLWVFTSREGTTYGRQWVNRWNGTAWSGWLPQNDLPSNNYVNISWPASGSTVTALHDGYVVARRSGSGASVYVENQTRGQIADASTGNPAVANIECNKGDVIYISYTGTDVFLRNVKSNRTV